MQNNIDELIEKYATLRGRATDNTENFLINKGIKSAFSSVKALGRYFLDNPYYRTLKKSPEFDELKREYEELHSHIKDKPLKNYLKKLWDCEHQSRSILIFYDTLYAHCGNIPESVQRIYKRQRTPEKEFQEALDRVYERIDDLLGGVPDEQ